MAAKQTASLIPMCHPLSITGVDIYFSLQEAKHLIVIEAQVKIVGQTGVEVQDRVR